MLKVAIFMGSGDSVAQGQRHPGESRDLIFLQRRKGEGFPASRDLRIIRHFKAVIPAQAGIHIL
ncbi:hypothetical protein COO09_02785 [Rhizorhabdus dicambivorans]|uniref:Uncharacterized protein n=1 Tax=Rhizorhabdus dicambivorans TaxID=1850238 RepID=A0A2A4G066_9SPHN|nr:hypothetical protein COO09_02785 [Rhizorhabdus dicambivorans]